MQTEYEMLQTHAKALISFTEKQSKGIYKDMFDFYTDTLMRLEIFTHFYQKKVSHKPNPLGVRAKWIVEGINVNYPK